MCDAARALMAVGTMGLSEAGGIRPILEATVGGLTPTPPAPPPIAIPSSEDEDKAANDEGERERRNRRRLALSRTFTSPAGAFVEQAAVGRNTLTGQ